MATVDREMAKSRAARRNFFTSPLFIEQNRFATSDPRAYLVADVAHAAVPWMGWGVFVRRLCRSCRTNRRPGSNAKWGGGVTSGAKVSVEFSQGLEAGVGRKRKENAPRE